MRPPCPGGTPSPRGCQLQTRASCSLPSFLTSPLSSPPPGTQAGPGSSAGGWNQREPPGHPASPLGSQARNPDASLCPWVSGFSLPHVSLSLSFSFPVFLHPPSSHQPVITPQLLFSQEWPQRVPSGRRAWAPLPPSRSLAAGPATAGTLPGPSLFPPPRLVHALADREPGSWTGQAVGSVGTSGVILSRCRRRGRDSHAGVQMLAFWARLLVCKMGSAFELVFGCHQGPGGAGWACGAPALPAQDGGAAQLGSQPHSVHWSSCPWGAESLSCSRG